MNYIAKIREMGACQSAISWLEGGDYKTLNDAWQSCRRGDWMLWLLGRFSGLPDSSSHRKLVIATCQCARLALRHVAENEDSPLRTIEITEAWARGDAGVTLDKVRAAADAAADASYAAADAAAYAAYAAYAAAYAAADAAYAANAVAYAADAAAYAANNAYAARVARRRICANIVRDYYPLAPDLEGGETQ